MLDQYGPSPLEQALTTLRALETLRQVSARFSADVLTPRKCVGCTAGLQDLALCAACYAALYPREDPTGGTTA